MRSKSNEVTWPVPSRPLLGTLARLLLSAVETDRTAQAVIGATFADLDPERLRQFQRCVSRQGHDPGSGKTPARELIRNLGLIHADDVTLAALLLLGSPDAIARWAPQHEVIFLRVRSTTEIDPPHNLRGPILDMLDELHRLLDENLRLETLPPESFHDLNVPDLTWWSAREAVMNAFIHRDYLVHQSIQAELFFDRFVVTSGGGLIGGVTPTNILRHAPAHRNPLLAHALQAAGFATGSGAGLDRVHEEWLRYGKAIPILETDEASVRLTLPTATNLPFARFVADEDRSGHVLDLDDLLLLRTLADRGPIDHWMGGQVMQTTKEVAAASLATLCARRYVHAHGRGPGTRYELTRHFSELLSNRNDVPTIAAIDVRAVRLVVEARLAGAGVLTNAEVRGLFGYSRAEALRLMRELRGEGIVEFRGGGRGAHYGAGPALTNPGRGPTSTADGSVSCS